MKYKTLLADADGVLYHGDEPIDGVRETLLWLKEQAVRLIILTNNAVANPHDYANKLNGLYFKDEPFITGDQVVTPLHVVKPFFEYMRASQGEKFNNRVMRLGGMGPLETRLRESGLEVVDTRREGPENIGWVVVSEIREFRDLTLIPDAYSAVNDFGAAIVGTNSDTADKRKGRSWPVTGTTVNTLLSEPTVDVPLYWLGKESRRIYDFVFSKLAIPEGEKHLVCAAGDRYETDGYGAKNYGITSILVDSPNGIAGISDLETYLRISSERVRLLYGTGERPPEFFKDEGRKYVPDYVISGLRDIMDEDFERFAFTRDL